MALTIVTGATLDGLCAGSHKKAVSGVLNINTGTAQEFMLFPGVGKARADAIVEARATGNFTSVDDLARVKGIGPKFIEKFRSNLSVDGTSSIQKAEALDATASTSTALPQPVKGSGMTAK
ncbi:MAG: hypothetical protein COV45_00750 [Deltaproteobacteria bacterium CG11_big_fil_rev_8_21_14_0_20_47_16]|nr:MAG: hypothetical protein COV45_00750 [Deltaproteobacteria bacterium CG11_big_fil_rev_8_21_14_0_20_47_16]